MSGFLVGDAVANQLLDLHVVCVTAKEFSCIPFFDGKEAVADLTFGGDSQSVAIVAKRLRDRINKSDAATTGPKVVIDGRLAWVFSMSWLKRAKR